MESAMKGIKVVFGQMTIMVLLFPVIALSLSKIWDQMRSFSISCWRDWICGFSCDPSWTVTEHAITERETPHARPNAKIQSTS